tara:strand:+ start:244892 stop:246133 length:1242 start_codon:yes stop_codon:yes gene_type:complete
MENVIEHLVSIAGELDEQGLSDFADRVDVIAEDVLDIKTAQYVGSQGYWIRNTRCWSNCYRQKRASNPKQAAQEIWADCHEEYLNSINNPGTSWDKYAGNDSDKLIKSASARQELDTKLASSIDKKVSNGSDLRVAIAEALEEAKYEHFNRLISASNKLLDMAESSSNLGLSIKLGNAAAMLTREAQRAWYNPATWVDKGIRGLGDAKDWAGQKATDMRNQAIERGVSDREQRAIRNLDDAAKMRNKLQDRGVAQPAAPAGAQGVNVGTQPAAPAADPTQTGQPAAPAQTGQPNAQPAGSTISGPGDNVGGELYTPPGGGQNAPAPSSQATEPAQSGGIDDGLQPAGGGAFDATQVQGHIDEQVENLARQQVLLQQQLDALSGIIGKDRATKAIAKARQGLQSAETPAEQSAG